MSPIFVALDTTDLDRAEQLAGGLRPHVGGLKLGLEFFLAHGRAGVDRLATAGLPVFLDLKLHDIPNTVAKAIAALGETRPAVLTVHVAGGREMLARARDAAPPETRVVGVTTLTSLDAADLRAIGVDRDPAAQVAGLAALARSAGIDGVVCSGEEVAAVRAAWPESYLVVPGIRPAGGEVGDQKRVVTPADALARGASMLVIGRPITAAADPVAAAAAIAATL